MSVTVVLDITCSSHFLQTKVRDPSAKDRENIVTLFKSFIKQYQSERNYEKKMYCSIDFVRDMPFLLKKVPSCFQHLGFRSRRYLGFFDIKSYAIENTKEYSFDLSDYSERLKNDFDVVTAAVSRNGHALKHASHDLKNNKRIVLSAVSQNGNSLQHASKEMRADRKIVIAAIKQNGYALEFASYDLRNDPKVVSIAALQFPCSINNASKELLNNYDFITGCIKKNPAIKKYIQIPKPKPTTETKVVKK